MQDQELREAYEGLHLELLRASAPNAEAAARRDRLAAHIRDALARNDFREHTSSIATLWDDTMIAFRASHPALAGFIEAVKNMAASMGI